MSKVDILKARAAVRFSLYVGRYIFRQRVFPRCTIDVTEKGER